MEEDRVRADLAEVVGRINVQEEIRSKTRRLLNEEMDDFEKKHRDDFSISLIKMYDMYLERLNAESKQAQENVERIQPELEGVRLRLSESSRKRKVVEQLKARQKERHKEELRKYERKQIDESNYMRERNDLFNRWELTAKTGKTPSGMETNYDDENEFERKRELDVLAEYLEKKGLDDPRRKK